MDHFVIARKGQTSISDIFTALISTYLGYSVPIVLNKMNKTCAQCKMMPEVVDILQVFANDVHCCNMFLKALDHMEKLELIMETFKELQGRGFCPTNTWNYVVETY